MTLGRTEYVDALRREGAALADAAEPALDKPVPACPGWSVADLVAHTWGVHYFWRTIVGQKITTDEEVNALKKPEPPSEDRLVAAFRQGVEETAKVLEGADPSAPCWSWSEQKNNAFAQRRMAQETVVHRYDVQAAAGAPQPIEPGLAADGIDEFLMFFRAGDARLTGSGETVHVHCTDVPGEWTLTFASAGPRIDQSHGKADAAMRGKASDLLLVLWERLPRQAVERFGEGELLDSFFAAWDRD